MRRGIIGKSKWVDPLVHHFPLENNRTDVASGAGVYNVSGGFTFDSYMNRYVLGSSVNGGFSFYLDPRMKTTTSNMTISTWYKMDSSSHRCYLIMFGSISTYNTDFIDDSTGSLGIGTRNTQSNVVKAKKYPFSYDSNWHHIVGTVSRIDRLLRLYIDNVFIGTSRTLSSYLLDTNYAWGNYANIFAFNYGYLSSVRFYDTILNTDEISYLYNNKL